MNNYKVEKLPKMEKSGFEKWMARLGGPIAALVFILIYWVVDIPLFDNLYFSELSAKVQARLAVIGEAASIEDESRVFDESGTISTVSVEKIYYVNIIFQLQHDSDVEYHHFRITMTRNGIVSIDEV